MTRSPRLRVLLALASGALILALAMLPSCGGGDGGTTSGGTSTGAASAGSFEKMDFAALPDDLALAIAEVQKVQPWDPREKAHIKGAEGNDPRDLLELEMTPELLQESYALGSAFLVNWQKPAGNFRYMYDWTEGTWVEDDNQVRQAGSLWGISTCHRYKPTDESRAALDKGLEFWFDNTVDGPREGTLTVKYPGEDNVTSGTVALVALSIVEYLKTDEPMDEAYEAELNEKLDGYLRFLQWLQRDNGHIAKEYRHPTKTKTNRSSPYYDGESLLCLCKAARELDRDWLVPTIEVAAAAMAKTYTIESWAKDPDSKTTKGFYQWGSMSFVEYYLAQWKDHELFGDVCLSLGWWMTHAHSTLKKNRNHAYAVEGLISSWRIANMRGDVPAQTDLLYTLDRSLHKLGSWQINGPLAKNNSFLKKNPTDDPLAHGGVMNARRPSGADVKKDVSHQLRIDVTQHQMHATTLAIEEVYVEHRGPKPAPAEPARAEAPPQTVSEDAPEAAPADGAPVEAATTE